MTTREQVEAILRRWGNEVSRADQVAGQTIAGDRCPVSHARAVKVLVDLVEGKPPTERKCVWFVDTNREDAER